jgi:hypothetical protein
MRGQQLAVLDDEKYLAVFVRRGYMAACRRKFHSY